MEYSGREISLGIGVEETRGTALLAATRWLRKVTANVFERSEKAMDDTTAGQLEDAIGSRVVRKWIEGDVQGILHADAIGFLLYNLYGQVASGTKAGESVVYEHVFTLDQTVLHPSLCLFAKDGGVQQSAFQNAMLNTLQITAVPDDYVRFTANFLAKNATSNSDTPDYTTTEYDFIGKDVTVKFADSVAGLGAATAKKVKELNITWDQGLVPDNVLGSYFPADIHNQKHSIEFEITRNMDDTYFKDLYLGDGYKVCEITITSASQIGSASNPSLVIRLYKVQVQDWSREGSNDALVTEPISFKAFRDETNGMSRVTLVNKTAEYEPNVSA